MRFLHTSDWHLGRTLLRQDLLGAQANFLNHLVEVVRSERVDAVLVSGDIFDRAIPPLDAITMYDEVLRRLVDAGASVIITSGNHDSATRLGINAGLISRAGVHVRTRIDQVGTPVLLPDTYGEVAIYGLPYLDPDLARSQLDLPERSHQAAISAAMQRVRADLAGRPSSTRSVVMAHAWVSGGLSCNSERELTLGGIADVPLSHFADFDYAALGHLHGRQKLTESVRYSGSPVAYSFSETNHVKGSWLVELDSSGLSTVDFVQAPVERKLARISGTLDQLLHDPAHAHAESAWVHATVTDPQRPNDVGDRLRRRFEHLLQCPWQPRDQSSVVQQRPLTDRIVGRASADVVFDFVSAVRGREADADERALVSEGLQCCLAEESVV